MWEVCILRARRRVQVLKMLSHTTLTRGGGLQLPRLSYLFCCCCWNFAAAFPKIWLTDTPLDASMSATVAPWKSTRVLIIFCEMFWFPFLNATSPPTSTPAVRSPPAMTSGLRLYEVLGDGNISSGISSGAPPRIPPPPMSGEPPPSRDVIGSGNLKTMKTTNEEWAENSVWCMWLGGEEEERERGLTLTLTLTLTRIFGLVLNRSYLDLSPIF